MEELPPDIRALARRRIDFAAPCDRAFTADDLAQEIATAVYRGRAYFRPDRGRRSELAIAAALRRGWVGVPSS